MSSKEQSVAKLELCGRGILFSERYQFLFGGRNFTTLKDRYNAGGCFYLPNDWN